MDGETVTLTRSINYLSSQDVKSGQAPVNIANFDNHA
jgi:hypothetical protein